MIKELLMCSFFFTFISCMDAPLLQYDFFSQQSNVMRRRFIFPLLKVSKTVEKARKTILSIALICRTSYEQMMCPFFLKDMLRTLGDRFIESDMSIVTLLKMPRVENYADMHKKMFKFTCIKDFPSTYLDYFSYLIDRGADINYTFSQESISLLMRAVYVNNFDLVKFFIKKGADCSAYGYRKEEGVKQKNYYTRDFNMIYHHEKLDQCFSFQSDNQERLRIALDIDAYLERKKAPSDVTVYNHPLMVSLTKNLTAMENKAFVCSLYNNNKQIIRQHTPRAIAALLSDFIGE